MGYAYHTKIDDREKTRNVNTNCDTVVLQGDQLKFRSSFELNWRRFVQSIYDTDYYELLAWRYEGSLDCRLSLGIWVASGAGEWQ